MDACEDPDINHASNDDQFSVGRDDCSSLSTSTADEACCKDHGNMMCSTPKANEVFRSM